MMATPNDNRGMRQGDTRESAAEHLRKALSATDTEDKNYHVRQAIQLLKLCE